MSPFSAGCTNEDHADARAGGDEGPSSDAVWAAVQRAVKKPQGLIIFEHDWPERFDDI